MFMICPSSSKISERYAESLFFGTQGEVHPIFHSTNLLGKYQGGSPCERTCSRVSEEDGLGCSSTFGVGLARKVLPLSEPLPEYPPRTVCDLRQGGSEVARSPFDELPEQFFFPRLSNVNEPPQVGLPLGILTNMYIKNSLSRHRKIGRAHV